MGKVRKFELADIEQVIDLNIKSFPGSKNLSRDSQYEIFKNICFHNPWYNEDVRSLVYEESNGRIKGFLGVIPKPFNFNGENILVGVAQHLMVDQVPLASLQLFREFFSGPQVLSITDMAVDIGKQLWDRLGGNTIYLHSIYWRKPLLPLSFLISFRKKDHLINTKSSFLSQSINIIDRFISHLPYSPLKFVKGDYLLRDLEVSEYLGNLDRYIHNKTLKPVYDYKSLTWLFDRLKIEKRFGNFQKIIVTTNNGEILGWFMYNLLPKGSSQVLQIVADEQSVGKVLHALFYHAWSNNTVELLGRLDPLYMQLLFKNKCLFMPGRNWMLAYTKRKEILDALNSNDAFFTRLEGDLWFF